MRVPTVFRGSFYLGLLFLFFFPFLNIFDAAIVNFLFQFFISFANLVPQLNGNKSHALGPPLFCTLVLSLDTRTNTYTHTNTLTHILTHTLTQTLVKLYGIVRAILLPGGCDPCTYLCFNVRVYERMFVRMYIHLNDYVCIVKKKLITSIYHSDRRDSPTGFRRIIKNM